MPLKYLQLAESYFQTLIQIINFSSYKNIISKSLWSDFSQFFFQEWRYLILQGKGKGKFDLPSEDFQKKIEKIQTEVSI